MVRTLIRAEGLGIFLASAYIYGLSGGSWLHFILLLLLPDISITGFFIGKKEGTVTYNLVHNYVLGLLIVFIGILFNSEFLTQFGFVITAHVGMDRFFGLGLKYPSGFKDTHIQKL